LILHLILAYWEFSSYCPFLHLKNFGHKPIALVGGATGMIGDQESQMKEPS
jgi:tyrosyl-tRNA synthetase